MTTVRVIEVRELAKQLAERLRISATEFAGSLPPDALVAEWIRGVLAAECGLQQLEPSPIYTTSLLNRVRSQLSPLWTALRHEQEDSSQEGDLLRRMLDSLEDLRDVEHIGRGYWLPTPLRLVRLTPQTALVVGGLPVMLIERELGCSVHHVWITRTVATADLTAGWLEDDRKWQALDQWMGFPPADLSTWLAGRRKKAEVSLVRSSSEMDDFEAYLPSLAPRGDPQWFRWVERRSLIEAPGELVLCRTRGGRFSQRRYWWARLGQSRGGIRPQHEAPVDIPDVRRLQYALDQEHHNPTSIRVTDDDETTVFVLRSAVPAEERRLMLALSEDISDTPGRYPIRLRVPKRIRRRIEKSLVGLGVELI